jgi:hypothetical protein
MSTLKQETQAETYAVVLRSWLYFGLHTVQNRVLLVLVRCSCQTFQLLKTKQVKDEMKKYSFSGQHQHILTVIDTTVTATVTTFTTVTTVTTAATVIITPSDRCHSGVPWCDGVPQDTLPSPPSAG